jgi:NADH dehydrogenase [ubiquinone] 1 alpha subcomplex assembly factor 1
MFSGLAVRLRGDGRTYIWNIQTDGLRDDDLYQCFMYTCGGPDFQTFFLPFDDFLLTSQGYVQNEQMRLNARKIRTMGVLLADRIEVCSGQHVI